MDLSATLADLLGIQAPGAWQGHSMFDPARPQRAYYLASIGEYLFGVREGQMEVHLRSDEWPGVSHGSDRRSRMN